MKYTKEIINKVLNLFFKQHFDKIIDKGDTPWQFTKNKEIYNFYQKQYPGFVEKINELIYWKRKNDKQELLKEMLCSCGNKKTFQYLSTGYYSSCSPRCGALNNNFKIKQTCIKKYGVDSYSKTQEFKTKTRQTKLERYKNEKFVNPEKAKQTCFKKYGVTNPFASLKIQEKIKKKNLDKYGVEYYTQTKIFQEQRKETNKKRYGSEHYSQTTQWKSLFKDWEKVKEYQDKSFLTKKKNNSFNVSKKEDMCFELLKQKYPNIIHAYKSKLYPFNCDFYIPSLDLYIELNYHWTHGKEPFNKDNKEHIEILNLWKNKNTNFYKNAIEVWTIRDVKKLKTFKENKLNYKIFYTEKEFKEWFNNL